MKHTLLLTALMGFGLCYQSAFADEWVKPVPEATQFQYEDTLYMYNVGAKGFFSDEGGAYGTQAMIADRGIKMYIQKYIDPELTPPDSIWDGKTVLIWDYSTQHNKWFNLYINDGSVIYVDRASQPNYFFQLEDMGNGVYRIYGADINPSLSQLIYPDTYVGCDLTNPEDKSLKPLLNVNPENDPNYANYCVDWIFVSPEEYAKVQEELITYNLAMELKAKIDEALGNGVEVNSALAVYNNTSSTNEQIRDAMESVDDAMRIAIENSASPDNFLDMASEGYLVNPTFDNDASGWLSTTGAQNQGVVSTQSESSGGVFIGNAWENWHSAAYIGKMYQLIPNALHGVYRFTLGARSDSNGGAYVYCAGDSIELTGTLAKTLSVLTVFEGDTLELGLKKNINVGQWMLIDNAVLTYYGNSAESYLYWINTTIDAAPDFTDAYKQTVAFDEYNKVIEDIKKLTTKEELMASVNVYKDALARMQANVDAYAAYAVLVEDAKNAVDETGNEELSDYVINNAEPNLWNGVLSTEEIIAEATELKNMIETARRNNIIEGAECSFLIVNNDFRDGINDWIVDDSFGTPVVGGAEDNPCVERWNDNFDMYQEIANIPNGVYRLEVPAFYRTEGNDGAWNNRETAEILTYLYINDQYAPVANQMLEDIPESGVYSSAYVTPNGTYIPNDMVSVSTAFANGLYKNTMYGIVTDGTMRVGIRNTTGSMGDRWSIWGTFKLYYEGYNADVIKDILQPLVDEARDTVNNCLFSIADKEALIERYAAASNAISTDADGETLFNLYLGFNDLIDAAKASIESYKNLYDYTEKLVLVIDETQNTASDEAVTNASVVYDNIISGYESESFTTEEADSMIIVIKGAITKLRIPDTVASDDEPADFTSVIVNPNYDNEDNEGWSGSSAGHQTYQNAEFYNTNFDMYQIIYGLPNGTYELKISGFYRDMSLAVETYQARIDGTETIHAFLYAESNGITSSAPLMSILDDYSVSGLNNGVDEIKLEDEMYVPNQMSTSAMYFESGYYKDNSVFCNVTDGTLKIGLKKGVTNGGDWAIFDNWKLFYYGDASSHEADGDASGIESETEADVISRTYYTLGGMQSSVPVRGINIVKSVMSDGTVRINKIVVR